MTTDATLSLPPRKQSRARKVVATLLTLVVLLIVGGGIAFYQLGKVDPRDPATAQLAWGDRVEKRLDAIIDKKRPKWADQLEEGLDGIARKVGWN